MSVQTWTCARPSCGAHNVARNSYCAVCQAPRPSQSAAVLTERRIPPVDLEEFCRRNFTRGAKRHLAEVEIVNNQVFLTLTPDAGRRSHADPAIYELDENDATPCDNFGRPGW